MKHLGLFLLLVGCGPVEPGPVCPVVRCGWVDDPATLTQSCPPPYDYTSTKRLENACWLHEETCRAPTWGPTEPAPAVCPVQDCKRAYVDCQGSQL